MSAKSVWWAIGEGALEIIAKRTRRQDWAKRLGVYADDVRHLEQRLAALRPFLEEVGDLTHQDPRAVAREYGWHIRERYAGARGEWFRGAVRLLEEHPEVQSYFLENGYGSLLVNFYFLAEVVRLSEAEVAPAPTTAKERKETPEEYRARRVAGIFQRAEAEQEAIANFLRMADENGLDEDQRDRYVQQLRDLFASKQGGRNGDQFTQY